MKIKKVTITGMHKIGQKSYSINDGVTYFIGPNGAGKSTVLEAIQLGLLGYIPGYDKTNASIMRHSNSGIMNVSLELDDKLVSRTWTKSGSSVTSNADTAGIDLEALTSGVTLPVFDFNKFNSMTANDLKKYFISMLPKESSDVSITDELRRSIGERALPCEELIADVSSWLDHNKDTQGVDLIVKLNAKLKADQQYVKGQVSKLQGTIQSLVRYDDADELDSSDIEANISELSDLRAKLVQYNAEMKMRESALTELTRFKDTLSAESYDSDPNVITLEGNADSLNKQLDVMKADYQDLCSEISDLERQKSMIVTANAVCPYTKERCEKAESLASKAEQERKELEEKITFKKEELKDCDQTKQSAISREIMGIVSKLSTIQAQYDKFAAIKMQLDNFKVSDPVNCNMSVEDIDAELKELRNKLVQIEANKKYDELADAVTADKFKLENDLEVYKIWIKATDANGLQSTMMQKSFESMEADMSNYLTQLFNKETKAKFNLEAKANSFSFGLIRDGKYIEFDYLSSGERCLFEIALMMCILDKSNSILRVIVLDDMLDHLDDDNGKFIFDALKNVSNIQFILAGVKPCSDSSICISV